MTPENADRGRLSKEKRGGPIKARQTSRTNDREKIASTITRYYGKQNRVGKQPIQKYGN